MGEEAQADVRIRRVKGAEAEVGGKGAEAEVGGKGAKLRRRANVGRLRVMTKIIQKMIACKKIDFPRKNACGAPCTLPGPSTVSSRFLQAFICSDDGRHSLRLDEVTWMQLLLLESGWLNSDCTWLFVPILASPLPFAVWPTSPGVPDEI